MLVTASAEETEAAGRRLARHLAAGDLLLLAGPLGAGKTTFVRGLASGLGVDGQVQSPTFQLLRLHRGDPALVHVDLYRLEAAAELAELGLEEFLDEAVVAVEWGDRLTSPAAGRQAVVEFEDLGDGRRRLVLREAPDAWSW